VSRAAAAGFALLVAATVAAFFVTQRLKTTDPVVIGVRTLGFFSPVTKGPQRATYASFFLKRDDDVTVTVLDSQGDRVATLADGRSVPARTRVTFRWDGRDANGRIEPDGDYFFRVGLARQGRSLTLPFPQDLDTRPPRPVVMRVEPRQGHGPLILPRAGGGGATAVFRGTKGRRARGLVIRTDVVPARVVRTIRIGPDRRRFRWDGLVGGRPAPDGTYLLGLYMVDRAGNPGTFPARLPPFAGEVRTRPGVTVRRLAVSAPSGVTVAGRVASFRIEARGRRYEWALRRLGTARPVARGAGRAGRLRLRVPRRAAGVYTLSVAASGRRMAVPVTVRARPARVLVVVPAMTFQALNPVDGDGNGIPDTLPNGGPVPLDRVYARTPPGLASQVAPVLRFLDDERLPYDLTTDAALARAEGPRLDGQTGVALIGDEPWLTAPLASALRRFASRGGRVLTLGFGDLRRTATLAAGALRRPTPPSAVGALGARPGPALRGPLDVLAYRDDIGLFRGTGGGFGTWPAASVVRGVVPGAGIVAAAGPRAGVPVIAAWRLGRGLVIRTGLPGFQARLASDFGAQALVRRAWTLLRGG